MTSYLFELDHPKQEAAASFVSETGRGLQSALLSRKALKKITQQQIAERLEIDRSRVNKCLSGYANLTLESLAELCWAMDVKPFVVFEQLLPGTAANFPHGAEAFEHNVIRVEGPKSQPTTQAGRTFTKLVHG